jgi:hypothetical protein
MPWMHAVPSLLAQPSSLRKVFLQPTLDGLAIPASYTVVAAFDFGRIANRNFLTSLKCLAEITNLTKVFAEAIQPDPVEYYIKNFNAVPAFCIENNTSADDFIQDLNWDPEGGGADSMASHSEKLVFLGDNIPWVILGERRFELARLFVRQDIKILNLQKCFPVDILYDHSDIFGCLINAGVSEEMANATSNQLC